MQQICGVGTTDKAQRHLVEKRSKLAGGTTNSSLLKKEEALVTSRPSLATTQALQAGADGTSCDPTGKAPGTLDALHCVQRRRAATA